jgi:hypothetical protein
MLITTKSLIISNPAFHGLSAERMRSGILNFQRRILFLELNREALKLFAERQKHTTKIDITVLSTTEEFKLGIRN